MKIAIFNNFLDNIGGAEIVTLTLARELNADIYTTNINPDTIIKMGFEDVLPRIFSIGEIPKQAPFRHQLAFYKFRKLNLSGKYDHFIISGDWAMSGAVNNHPNIWYAYSPLNELWEFKDWIRGNVLSAWKRPFYDIFVWFNRILTLKYAKSVDVFVADAENVKKRLKKYYGVDSIVIYPPTDTSKYYWKPHKNYWLSVNRIITHKRIELQMQAFAKMPDEKLIIVGSYEKGARQFEDYKKYIEGLKPNNVEILNWVSKEELKSLYSECKGFITTARDEDFGMTPVEAMASGKPVIAPNEGGYKETVVDGRTGILIDDISSDKIIAAVKEITKNLFVYKNVCIDRANDYSKSIFIKKMMTIIKQRDIRKLKIKSSAGGTSFKAHRSGWPFVMSVLNRYNNPAGVLLEDFIEKKFSWGYDYGDALNHPTPIEELWVGIFHVPELVPSWNNKLGQTPKEVFSKELFQKSLPYCLGFFCLSQHEKSIISKYTDLPVDVLYHPTGKPKVYFSMDEFISNPQKTVFQIGYFIRDLTAIYQLKTSILTKCIIRTNKNYGYYLENSIKESKEKINIDENIIKIDHLSDEDYDIALSKNIVFAKYLDASASNLVIECIIRNTPILINKIPAIVEYLGEDYPFYYKDIEEASRMIDNLDLIKKANIYLENYKFKEKLGEEYFIKSLFESDLYKSLPNNRRIIKRIYIVRSIIDHIRKAHGYLVLFVDRSMGEVGIILKRRCPRVYKILKDIIH